MPAYSPGITCQVTVGPLYCDLTEWPIGSADHGVSVFRGLQADRLGYQVRVQVGLFQSQSHPVHGLKTAPRPHRAVGSH